MSAAATDAPGIVFTERWMTIEESVAWIGEQERAGTGSVTICEVTDGKGNVHAVTVAGPGWRVIQPTGQDGCILLTAGEPR